MAANRYIEDVIWLAFHVDDFVDLLRSLPAFRCGDLAVRVQLLDEEILHVRTEIGKSPRDAPVVTDDHERKAWQRDAGNIEILTITFGEVSLVPDVWNRMTEMHVVRQ